MTQWATFAGLSGVVCALLLVLSHATKTTLTEPAAGSDLGGDSSGTDTGTDGDTDTDADDDRPTASSSSSSPSTSSPTSPSSDLESSTRTHTVQREEGDSRAPADSVASKTEPNSRSDTPLEHTATGDGEPAPNPTGPRADPDLGGEEPLMDSMSSGALLANVALSQGLFAALLIAAAFYTEIPAAELGIEFTSEYLFSGLAVGTGIGLGLYVANEFGSTIAKRLEIDHSEDLREMLAPDSAGGWLILLLVVLPMIAIFEEFLFRAALIGAVSAGFGVSPWILAVLSSVAFALGHGMQGTTGIAVTGLLGFVLAAAFILTGSFLVVVVAHYLINALEFVVHEGIGLEWGESGGQTGAG